MAKVFRLHQGADGTGWFVSKPLTRENLESIKTEGKDVATSIPSPFARIDLVKSAFAWVAANKIEGKSAHHKLVSDSLDIGQLFFNYQKFEDKISIISWSPKERFKELIENHSNIKHSNFASTLKIYWDQDSKKEGDLTGNVLYNFERLNRLYLILNKETNHVLGGTSPITLFFASPDVHEIARSLKITIAQDQLFDYEYTSLAGRDPSFIEYMYALAKQNNFSSYFPELFAYMEVVRKYLPSELKIKIASLVIDDLNNYLPCTVLNNPGDLCEVIGFKLKTQTEINSRIEKESDFIIKTDFAFSGPKPMILPDLKFNQPWTYTIKGTLWDENTEVQKMNQRSSSDSYLPVQGDKYYWLSISNFLEEKIIKFPYSIDNSCFITCGGISFLIPLTSTFFKYFSVNDVNKQLKLEKRAGGGIEVRLIIPVRGGSIEFKRIYSLNEQVTLKIHLAILPFIKSENVSLDYTIGIIDDRDNRNDNIGINCFNMGSQVDLSSPVIRRPGEGKDQKSLYYKIHGKFDRIQLTTKQVNGFIVPIMKMSNGSRPIHYAIDFGTTNTHIEYKEGNNAPIPFNNNTDQTIWKSLFDWSDPSKDRELESNEFIFGSELMPSSASNEDAFSYPSRTALLHNSHIDLHNLDIFLHTNNYLLLEKRHYPSYLELLTKELKWSNYSEEKNRKMVECYIEFLITLTFYKTIILGGDTAKTKITWFYPVSMDQYELKVLFTTWENSFKKIYNCDSTNGNLIGIPESIAPYMFYKGPTPGLCLSIDIGGGSSDLAVFDEFDNTAKIISSFKFAGNAIFGDGYGNDSDRNGFVNSFLQDASQATQKGHVDNSILEDIINTRKDSADFSSFLFSLETKTHKGFSYSRLIQKNKRMKLPIFIFYGAIIYYSAVLLKKSMINIPRNILLSGTAAKTASLIDPSETYKDLSEFFQFIFKHVYKVDFSPQIKVTLSDIPKEITCKGALKAVSLDSIQDNTVKYWLGGTNDIWDSVFDKKNDFNKTPKFIDIDEYSMESIKKGILEFYTILDEFVASYNIEDLFGTDIKAYQVFSSLRETNITDFLVRGLKAFYKENESHIEETLFFYPLIGILNQLAFDLSTNK